jgi:uncharacterized membrane protein
MARVSLLRLRLWWEDAFWVIPVIGILAAFMLDLSSVVVDEALFQDETLGRLISPAAAVTLLAAVGGGMVTFTGFVFSVVLLVLQFGSSEYSPRTVSYFLRTRSIQWVLAIFLATIVFTFLSVLEVGSNGNADFVPAGSVAFAVLLLVISLGAFLVLLNVVAKRIRVDAVLSDLGKRARRQLRWRYTMWRGGQETLLAKVPAPAADAVLARFAGRPGQIIAVDTIRLARVARRNGCRIVLSVRTGDAVSTGSPVAIVDDGTATDGEISRCLLVATERSLRYDPLYALRLLTDVSLRALSPGTNDPTTAARSLDEVEGVLRTAAGLPLGTVEVRAGEGRVVLRAPTWSDIVDLALLEVVDVGVAQPQVTRRVTAMINDLLAELPESRHRALLVYKRRLATEASERFDNERRAIALTGDRQGIGGSR